MPTPEQEANQAAASIDRHRRLSAAREGVVKALDKVDDRLHKLANGFGPKLTLGQMKQECRTLRDVARAALKELEEASK